MGFFSWFSADVDTGKKEYENMEEFIKDNPSYVRDKDSEKSSRKPCHGNGMIFSELSKLSFEDLQILATTSDNEYIKRSARVMLERKNPSEFDFSRRLRRR